MSTFVTLPLVLYPSRLRAASLLLASLAFVAGGVWLVRTGQSDGYFCLGVFGLSSLIFAGKLLPGASYLELTREGFAFRSLFRTRRVPWTRVQAFGTLPIRNQRYVAWNDVPSQPATTRAGDFSKAMTGFQAMLPDHYGMQPQELADLLNDLCRQHGGSGFEPPPRRPAL